MTGKALRAAYRKMQMVFQTPTDSFDPRRTLGDGIGESLRNSGSSRKEAAAETARLLERCGLSADLLHGIRTRSAAGSASAQRSPGRWP